MLSPLWCGCGCVAPDGWSGWLLPEHTSDHECNPSPAPCPLHSIPHTTPPFSTHPPTPHAHTPKLLSNTLYYKRFFPFYTFNLCAGLDEQGEAETGFRWMDR